MLFNFLPLLWAILQPTTALDAWHLDHAVVLVNEQLDPIVNPNAQSSHMHKVLGGSGFGASYNYETYRSAKCSSLKIQADKSNYWMPNLYFRNPSTGKFASVPVNPRFYYFLGRNSPTEPVQAFPEGLRILVGDPMAKTKTAEAIFQCQINSDFSGSIDGETFNFNRDCPWGMKTEIFFPPCWDGVNLYKQDGSHMSYPVNSLNAGSCPISHPVRLPAIMLEYTWLINMVMPGTPLAGNVFWANGDSTGFGIHADFVNGWDTDVLNRALNNAQCAIGSDGSLPMVDCEVFKPYLATDQAMRDCKPEAGVLREPFGNEDLIWLDALPGCNPIWGANGQKPTCSIPPPQLDLGGLTGRDGPLVADPSKQYKRVEATGSGWKEIMCIRNLNSVQGGFYYDDAKLSPQRCQSTCIKAGYMYAALGQVGPGNFVCQCGNSLDPSASYSPGSCTSPCPGDPSQKCGESYLFSVWQAGPGTISNAVVTPDGSTTLGCYGMPGDRNQGLQSSAKYTFSSSSMTRDVCIKACKEIGSNWAYTLSYNTCTCGTDWNLAPGPLLPDDFCPLACNGDSSQKCGDYYRGIVYNITSSTLASAPTVKAEGLLGCYNPAQLISESKFAYSSDTMTTGLCRRTCRSRGFGRAGLTSGNECFCSTADPKSSDLIAASLCNRACAGSLPGTTETCGAESRSGMSVFDTIGLGAQTPTGYPSNYVGCTGDGDPRQLTGHTFTSNALTALMCRDVCNSFGYAVYGTQYSSQCYCGTDLGSRGLIADSQCSAGCSGNSAERCGGGWILSLYDARQTASTPTTSPSTVSLSASSSSATSPPGSSSSTTTASPTPSASLAAPTVPGCFSSSSRDIASVLITSSAMSPSTCRLWCGVSGFTYAMMVNGDSCGCRNNLLALARADSSQCNTACSGAIKSFCGGSQGNIWNVASALTRSGICARHEARRLGISAPVADVPEYIELDS